MTRSETLVRPGSLWERHARQFGRMGPPLRPSFEDLEVVRGVLVARHERGRRTRVLVLGVTPEMAELGEHTLAVDRNPAMIRGVWPGYGRARDSYACGDWRHLPLGDGSRDVVLCDGGLTLVGYPDGHAAWTREVSRVLSSGGAAILRVFVHPDEPESPAAVLDDLRRGTILSFHAFKWRLAMALQEDPETGVVVDDVWRVWDEDGRDALDAAPVRRWPEGVVRTIEAYRELRARLHFPTLAEVRRVLGTRFEERGCVVPGYELGGRCPTLVLVPRDS